MKLRTYLEENHRRIWMDSKPKHKREAYRRVERFCEFRGNGDRDVSDFRANDVFVFIDHLITIQGLAESSANRYTAAIQLVINKAVGDEYRKTPIKCEKYTESEGRRYVFSQLEVERIVQLFKSWGHHDYADMCILSYQTGMRLGEIVNIGYSNEITEDEDGWPILYLKDTKNGDDREVYLSDEALAAAQRLRNLYSTFVAKRFYKAWGRLRKQMGVRDSEFTFHAFRHTAATHMANELKLNGKVIGDILGHRSPKTTARYIKTKRKSRREAAQQMPRVA